MLVSIFDALAFVRLRRALFADFCCELSDFLLVGTGNNDFVRCGYINGDAVDFGDEHLVRIPDIHNKFLALLGNTITDAVDFELFLKAFGHADDHVVQECTGKPVQGFVQVAVIGTGHDDRAVFHSDLHIVVYCSGKFPFGALHGNSTAVDFDIDACGNSDRLSADS